MKVLDWLPRLIWGPSCSGTLLQRGRQCYQVWRRSWLSRMVHCLAVPTLLVSLLDGSFYGLLNHLVAFSVLLLQGLRGLSGRLADGGWTASWGIWSLRGLPLPGN